MIIIENIKEAFVKEAMGANNLPFKKEGVSDEDTEFIANKLAKISSTEGKFLREIPVIMDITAPIYWWKEFDTYKVGVTRLSESTMHSICKKPFEISDFSVDETMETMIPYMEYIIQQLNSLRDLYLNGAKEKDGKYLIAPKDKKIWRMIIQSLPCNYMQKSHIMMNYEVIARIIIDRTNHKLSEWNKFIEIVTDNISKPELVRGRYANMIHKEILLREYMAICPAESMDELRKAVSKHREETVNGERKE